MKRFAMCRLGINSQYGNYTEKGLRTRLEQLGVKIDYELIENADIGETLDSRSTEGIQFEDWIIIWRMLDRE